MSKIRVFKTGLDELVILDEDRPNVVFNDKIPPTKLKQIYSFKSSSLKEYVEALIPLLFQRLKEDKGAAKLFEKISPYSIKD